MRALLFLAPLLLAGCYKTELTNFGGGNDAPGPQVKVWTHSVIVGLIPLSEVDVRKACGGKGAYSISTRQNVWNLLLAGVTSGIYTPTTAKITCRK